ncbi:armadillo repeat-containing protein 2 [Anopheles ziemanni]|uniref:armadillo repeat-containing protein 2 n=1 Tax=Anopheles coustani TaxID=139045 RepID=UPI0026592007|nr:armadillo repeat-containing protein 2 [Anopheles coustani]XP_058177739.1 armadillo repeat-containing protein 2 [Anopheles ziemanni]
MNNLRQQKLNPLVINAEDEPFSFSIQRSSGSGRLVRKTSAEIVSEAKNMLAGGTRLVSAQRPITPRESRRQLYGRVALPGRPPSAINLKYLQQGTHTLPLLEPIQTSAIRSDSVDENAGKDDKRSSIVGRSAPPLLVSREKLPALHCVHKATGSLENLSDYPNYENKTLCNNNNNNKSSTKLKPSDTSSLQSIVKNHPLKRRQVQSFDDQVTANTGSDQRKNTVEEQTKLLRKRHDLLVQSSTECLIDILKAYSGLKECDESTVAYISAILDEIYARTKGSKGNWRGAVLGALYGLVESSSPKILLSVACVVFAINVTGSNLTGACKLVFKIARNERNDSLFIDSDVPELLVDGLGRASPIDDPEACIYGYGAVRFLTGSPNVSSHGGSTQRFLVFRLVKHGLYQLMVLHLKIINEVASTRRLSGSPLHALFQLSGALRTLAGSPETQGLRNCHQPNNQQFTTDAEEAEQLDLGQTEQAVPLLVRAAEICIDEPEVQANIIRTLSVLSEHAECCERLAETASRLGILLGSIIQTSATVEKGLANSNRLGYILGNVMSRWDSARVQFYCCEVSLDALLATLEYYANKSFSLRNQMGDSIVQVMTKLIRVVANMCVNGDVGYGMSKRSPLGEILLNILLKVKEPKTAEMEELLFATLGALHNLSYYYESTETVAIGHRSPGSICDRLKDICGTLCSILGNEKNPARAEVARVLGNMTRTGTVRQTFCVENGLKILTRCLTSTSDELVVTSCGVVVNVLGDWTTRTTFREIDGPAMLRCILQRGIANKDWIMAGIACQAIWNYLIDTGNFLQVLGQPEIDLICGNLAEGLDEEHLFEGKDPDSFWDDFALVGTDLLERLQLGISGRNTPCEMSDDEAPEVNATKHW